MAEVYRKRDARFGAGLEGSFPSFGETSLVVLTLRCQIGNGEETAEWAYRGMTQGATTLLASSRHFSAGRGNTRILYWWNVPLVPDYKNIPWKIPLMSNSQNPKWYSLSYRIFLWFYWSFYFLSILLYSLLDIFHITAATVSLDSSGRATNGTQSTLLLQSCVRGTKKSFKTGTTTRTSTYELLLLLQQLAVKKILRYIVLQETISRHLEKHLQFSTTRSRWKKISETAVTLPQSSVECTKEPISALYQIMDLWQNSELEQNYEISLGGKNER